MLVMVTEEGRKHTRIRKRESLDNSDRGVLNEHPNVTGLKNYSIMLPGCNMQEEGITSHWKNSVTVSFQTGKTSAKFYSVVMVIADPSGRAVSGEGLRPLASCKCRLKFSDVCHLWVLCIVSDGLITRPEEPYRLSCVIMRDLETSRIRRRWAVAPKTDREFC
jgi:hypothetical protein